MHMMYIATVSEAQHRLANSSEIAKMCKNNQHHKAREQALRANLRRRKGQAQARKQGQLVAETDSVTPSSQSESQRDD